MQAEMTAMMEALVWLVTIISAFTLLALVVCLVGLIVDGLRETLRTIRRTQPAHRLAASAAPPPAAAHIRLHRTIAKPN